MFQFGERSRKALATCHPALQAVARRALELTPVDFTVTQGYRGREDQERAFATGHSHAHFGQSPHNHWPSLALDVVPHPVDWQDVGKFETIARAFKQAARERDVALRWGGDFHSLVDRPHFQIEEPAAGAWPTVSDDAPEADPSAFPVASREALADLAADALLARVLWGECRGVAADEARAIAHVVVNRASRPGWWGHTVKEVCLAPQQFSCLNPGDPNLAKILRGDFRDGSWPTCRREATDALAGSSADPTDGAVNYHAAAMRPFPSWADSRKLTARIGRHVFYKG